MEDRIREHAYFLWINNGRIGDANYFWLAAEQEILAAAEKETVLDAAPAVPQSAAQRIARRVNALVLLEIEPDREESVLGVAAE